MTNQVTEPRTNAIYIEVQYHPAAACADEENRVEFVFPERAAALVLSVTAWAAISAKLNISCINLHRIGSSSTTRTLLGKLISLRAYCKIHWFGLSMNWKP